MSCNGYCSIFMQHLIEHHVEEMALTNVVIQVHSIVYLDIVHVINPVRKMIHAVMMLIQYAVSNHNQVSKLEFDIINSIANNCIEGGMSTGNCTWSNTTSCYAEGGDCYCDSCCKNHKDCCPDVTYTYAQSKLVWQKSAVL